ncbi:MAG: hypothetical protein RIS87_139, partial [Pseudomonadota bacterium]
FTATVNALLVKKYLGLFQYLVGTFKR